MKQNFFRSAFYVLFVGCMLIFIGCNNEEKKEADNPVKEDTENATGKGKTTTTASFLAGTLDTLVLTAAEFKKLDKNKAEFIFHFGDPDTITVHGWKNKGGGSMYSTLPDVYFTKGNAGSLTYSTATYFGNLGLDKVNQINKTIIDSAATHVLFAPQLYYNHVWYKIFLSRGPHAMIPSGKALIPTGDETNPSPPKNPL